MSPTFFAIGFIGIFVIVCLYFYNRLEEFLRRMDLVEARITEDAEWAKYKFKALQEYLKIELSSEAKFTRKKKTKK